MATVVFTAKVTPAAATGTVTFYYGASLIGIGNVLRRHGCVHYICAQHRHSLQYLRGIRWERGLCGLWASQAIR